MAYQIIYGTATVPNFRFAFHDVDHPTLMAFNAVLDLNGDGLDDVIMTSSYGGLSGLDPSPIKVLISNGTTLVDRTNAFLPGVTGTFLLKDVLVADFNGDGKDDVFLNCEGTEGIDPFPGEQNRLFLSNSSGKYYDVSTTNLPQQTDTSHGAGFGDFDGDGDLDIFVNTIGGDDGIAAYLMLNDGNGAFTIVDSYHSDQGDWFPAEVSGLPGEGAGEYPNSNTYVVHVFDMNGDGYADIWTSGIEISSPDPAQNIFRGMVNDGNGHLVLSPSVGSFPGPANFPDRYAEVAWDSDLDRDGDQDLVVWLSGPEGPNQGLQIMINDGTGNFTDEAAARGVSPGSFAGSFADFGHAAVVDLDGDGDDDLIVPGLNRSDLTETTLAVFLNKGDGTFDHVPQSAFPFVRPGIQFLDVNGDGIKDILTDITYNGPWNEDHTKQFYLYLGKLDVVVTRNGWATDDRIFGGSKNDTLRGLRGDDFLQGNAGDDVMGGGIGRDALDGRTGSDTADYSDKAATVSVALNGAGKVNVKIGGVIEDTLRRIENVTGGSKNDTLTGDALANRLTGNAGLDTLNGGRGNDTLKGGIGADTLLGGGANDILVGGLGRDVMNGGAGADDFDFDTVADTGKTAATRDRIVDFRHLIDDIDLSTIDANGGTAGHRFIFLATEGARFHNVRGELRWFQVDAAGSANDKTFIEGDINGDRKADFQIELAGLKTLTEADFFL